MEGMVNLLSWVWEKRIEITKKDNEIYLSWEVFFSYRWGTVFLEFFTKEIQDKLKEDEEEEREESQENIKPSKLKSFYSYKKKWDQKNTYYVVPYFYWYSNSGRNGITKEKKSKLRKKDNMFLIRNILSNHYIEVVRFTWDFYEETFIWEEEILKKIKKENLESIKEREDYN